MNNLKNILYSIWGFVPLKVVSMTIKCGFCDYLSINQQATKSDLLKKFNWQERPFDRIADLLVDLALVQFSENGVRLTHISRKWLVKSSKNYIGDFIERANELSKAYDNIIPMMETDQPNSEMHESTINAFGKDSIATSVFGKSMDAMTKEFMQDATSKIDFENINNVLDIGAGLGTISCFLSNLYPEKEFTILELQGVADLSKQYVAENANNQTKIKVIASDWRNIKQHVNNSSFDLIILSQILHEEKKENSQKLIKICSDLLVDGGKLCVIGFLNNFGKCSYSILSHIFSLNMLFEMGSDNPNINEITELAKQNNVVFDKDYYLSAGRMLWLGHKQQI